MASTAKAKAIGAIVVPWTEIARAVRKRRQARSARRSPTTVMSRSPGGAGPDRNDVVLSLVQFIPCQSGRNVRTDPATDPRMDPGQVAAPTGAFVGAVVGGCGAGAVEGAVDAGGWVLVGAVGVVGSGDGGVVGLDVVGAGVERVGAGVERVGVGVAARDAVALFDDDVAVLVVADVAAFVVRRVATAPTGPVGAVELRPNRVIPLGEAEPTDGGGATSWTPAASAGDVGGVEDSSVATSTRWAPT